MGDTTIAFIINYNRLTLPRRIAEYLASCDGVEPVFLDNDSSYEPLLEWYEQCPYRVVRLGFNYGSAAVWHPQPAVLDRFGLDGHFVVTDPDLEIDHIPKDWLGVLKEGLRRHDFACKAGFSLQIDDLPNTEVGRQARGNQSIEWGHRIGNTIYYRSSIDTTFCLCRSRLHDFPAVRTGKPYQARHVPWYYTSWDDLPDDEKYYLESITPYKSNYWSGIIGENLGVNYDGEAS